MKDKHFEDFDSDEQVDGICPNWSNKPTLSDLKGDFDSVKTIHATQISRIRHWRSLLRPNNASKDNTTASNPYMTLAEQRAAKTRSTVKSKLVRKNAEWRYTSLSEPFLNTPDVFNVDPVTWEDMAASKQNALVLNNQVNTRLGKVAFIDEYIRAGCDDGTVIVKTGWDYESFIEERERPIHELRVTHDPKKIMLLDRAAQDTTGEVPPHIQQALEATQSSGVPYFPVKVGMETYEHEVVVKNQPSWEVCAPENVRIDPTCNGDMDRAEFVVHSFEASKSEMRKSGLYFNLDKIGQSNVTSDTDHESSWGDTGFTFEDDPRQKHVVHEYWGYWDIDGEGETKPIVAAWVENTLIRLEENPFPDGKLPFVVVPFMPLTNSVYGEPDAELLEDNQAISGAISRGVIDLLGKSANSQTGFRKGALDALNRRRYDRGQDYEFNDMGDAQNSIFQHKFPEVPVTATNYLQMQHQEAESLTGVISFGQGVTGKGLGSTAAAANGALTAADRRVLGILRRFTEGMKEIGRRFIAMNQEFLSENEVVRVTNEEFVKINRDDLAGRFDLRLSISTAEADEQKAQELSFMMQTTSQHMGQDFTKLILSEIADLRKMPTLSRRIANWEPKADPIAEQLKQLEVEEKRTEIQKRQAEIQKILAEAQKAGYNSEKLKAEADLENLNFVEQESGVAHARELDKLEAQSEAQAKTKIVEAALSAQTKNENK